MGCCRVILEVQQQGQNLAVIYKELDPFEAKAQEQMAYYLRLSLIHISEPTRPY